MLSPWWWLDSFYNVRIEWQICACYRFPYKVVYRLKIIIARVVFELHTIPAFAVSVLKAHKFYFPWVCSFCLCYLFALFLYFLVLVENRVMQYR